MHIGIDLGTTNSLISYFVDGQAKLIPNSNGGYLTPSVVGVLKSGELIVGQAAREYQVTYPERCVACFKRHMGTDYEADIGGTKFTAPQLSSFILRSLKHDAEQFLGQPVDQVVITVPAYFNEHQRQATRIATELAGLNVLRIINEPTAAALAYGISDSDDEKRVMVFDLGGGTFDVTLMDVFEGSLEIIGTAGENFLGGEDFTSAIAAWGLSKLGKELEIEELNNPLRVARLIQQAELAKRALNESNVVTLKIPCEQGTLDEADEFQLSRAEYTQATRTYQRRINGCLFRCLTDANLRPEDIDEIILAGGSTRMFLMHDIVLDTFGKSPKTHINPDHAIALGASTQAAVLQDDKSVEDIVLTDVCPHTLGVEIVKEFGGKLKDGYFLPLIHRNTTVPVCRERSVCTLQDFQKELLVSVYQGEGRTVEDNLKIGELRIPNLPKARAGLEVVVRFTYDANGILDLDVCIPENGKRYNAVLSTGVKSLSKEETEKALLKLREIKYFPRDDANNQLLLRFAERVVAEVPPFFRSEFELLIDSYEHAINLADRETFEYIRGELLAQLAAMGHEFKPEGTQ